jgi:hypothetical protein
VRGADLKIVEDMGREELPSRRERTTYEFDHNGHRFIGGVGRHPADGRACEVFLHGGKTGTMLSITMQDSAIAASLALQAGVSPETLANAFLKKDDGSDAGPLGRLFSLLLERGDRG